MLSGEPLEVVPLYSGLDGFGGLILADDHADAEHGSPGPLDDNEQHGRLADSPAIADGQGAPPNYSVSNVFIQDGLGQYVNELPVGERILVRLEFQTEGIASGSLINIAFEIDGLTVDYSINWASGTGGWWMTRWVGWTDPGDSNINVTMDSTNAIAESDESDNSGQVSVAAAAPIGRPTLEFPFDQESFVVNTNN